MAHKAAHGKRLQFYLSFYKGKDVSAFFFGWGNGFFEQHVVPHFQSLHTGDVVKIIRRCNDNGNGEFWMFKNMLPGHKAIFLRDVVFCGIAFIPNHSRLRYPNDIVFIWKGHAIIIIGFSGNGLPLPGSIKTV